MPTSSADELRALRQSACEDAASWLAKVGDLLWIDSSMTRDEGLEAIALAAQMAGELADVATASFASRHYYAGVALTRQIVEVHYLLTLFRDDPTQRQRWLNASPARIEKSFRPGQLRQAGNFHLGEYKTHSTFGGHPNPAARWLLPDHEAPIDRDLLLIDLAQHLYETCQLLQASVEGMTSGAALLEMLPVRPESLEAWQHRDPLARRVVLPPLKTSPDADE